MAKKVKRILFNTNYYESGVAKYEKDKHYPVTAETSTRVLAGDAVQVEVDMDPVDAAAEEAEAKARLDAERRATTDAEAAVLRGGDALPPA
jgi:hypothetical protein